MDLGDLKLKVALSDSFLFHCKNFFSLNLINQELTRLSKEIVALNPDFSKLQKQNTINKLNTLCVSLPYSVVLIDAFTGIPTYFCPKALSFLELPHLNNKILDSKIHNRILHRDNMYIVGECADHFLKNKNALFPFCVKLKKYDGEWSWVHGQSKQVAFAEKKYTVTIAQEVVSLMNELVAPKEEAKVAKEKLAKLWSLSKRERDVLILIVRE